MVYTTNTGSIGTVAQGIQQAWELYGWFFKIIDFIKISAINNNNKANQSVSFQSFALLSWAGSSRLKKNSIPQTIWNEKKEPLWKIEALFFFILSQSSQALSIH